MKLGDVMIKPRIYIDTSCFVDIISHKKGINLEEGRDIEIDYLQRILKAAENGDLEVYTSAITVAECRYPKGGQLDDEAKRLIMSVLSSGKVLTLVVPTIFISEKARDLTWEHNVSKLGGADALHIATALDRHCEEFLTVEKKALKNADKISKLGLKIVRPSETLCLPDKYKQDNFLEELYKKE